ncbi:MAG: hypothetical protein A2046_07740 [Bacteroidetes bacterium GWA2_30_7]|nr:MAG: hypothetical protein A2046_07740 [Bacteroidetes bacterium GWA2_30_7]
MRPNVLSIAGFDPSGGAGILADIKVFEFHKVYGFGACTAITYQNDNEFNGLQWFSSEEIIKQIELLFKKFPVEFVKIGIIKDLSTLIQVVDYLHYEIPNVKIIWDPVLKASAGYVFHNLKEMNVLDSLLKNIYLITPNKEEFQQMFKIPIENSANLNCNVLISGVESADGIYVNDLLISNNEHYIITGNKIGYYEKHGTGCSLSSSITSNLALGIDLVKSCTMAKNYVKSLLISNKSLLAYHNI